MNATIRYSAWNRFSQAPYVLKTYIIFAIIATVLSLAPIIAPQLSAVIVPYTGWSGFAIYPFTLFFAITACLTSQRKVIYSVVMLLLVGTAFGVLDTLRHTVWGESSRDTNNPYLIYNSLRPLITVVLPALWAALLMLPSVKIFTSNAE